MTIIKRSNIWELNLFNTRPVQSLFQSESGTLQYDPENSA